MTKKAIILSLLIYLVFMPGCAQSLAASSGERAGDCAEIKSLYDADQGDRTMMESSGSGSWLPQDMMKIAERDVERRKRTRQLLDDGSLKSADDYYHAAMVMQHGDKPDDFLLANILANASVKLGREKSAWLAAASLDRYLMKIGQPQIFGTQFNSAKPSDPSTWTNEPYNKTLVSDTLRKIYLQPTLDETQKRLENLKNNKPLKSTSPTD
jgi:hypothetical protein